MFDLRLKMKDPVVVAADLGFAKKGRNFAASLDAPIAFVEKRRSGDDARPAALTLIGNVDGRDVIVVDDEIDTGGSLSQAVKLVKEHGARDVYAVCVHSILSANAVERLVKLPLNSIITTDTVPISEEARNVLGDRLDVLSVAPLLGEVIRRAHEGRSVGEMFNE
jgi:ribose-phosphate pyrophosphokinase